MWSFSSLVHFMTIKFVVLNQVFHLWLNKLCMLLQLLFLDERYVKQALFIQYLKDMFKAETTTTKKSL